MSLITRQKVKVNIQEFAYGNEEIDEQLQGAIGEIVEVNEYVYPYKVKLEDQILNKLITNTPRQFGHNELITIKQ